MSGNTSANKTKPEIALKAALDELSGIYIAAHESAPSDAYYSLMQGIGDLIGVQPKTIPEMVAEEHEKTASGSPRVNLPYHSIPAFGHSLVTIEQENDLLTITIFADHEDVTGVAQLKITKEMLQ